MGDLILPSATAALAHKRLREASERLRDKVTAPRYDLIGVTTTRPVVVQPTDRRMLALLEGGRDLLGGHHKAHGPAGARIGTGLGTFAVLGTTGYDWPAYAEYAAGRPAWRTGAVRRGSPDPNHSAVNVPTTEFALQVGLRSLAKTTDPEISADIRAFAGGMLARAATDIVTGPVARGLRADVNTRRHGRHGPPAMGAASERALRYVLGGSAGSPGWQGWWPSFSNVDGALYDGYLEALEATYGFASADPTGFATFLESFEAGDPVSRKELEHGVRLLTGARVLEDWGLGHWYAVLTPALLSVPVTLLVGRYLDPASGFLSENGDANALGALQIFSLAHGLAAISPFALSMHLWTLVPGHSTAYISALVTGILRLILTAATVGSAAADSVATWPLWALQSGTDIYSLISGIVAAAQSRGADAFLHFINTLPSLMGLTATAFAAIFETADLRDDLGFWLTWAILTVLIMVPGGLGAAYGLSKAGGIGALFNPDADRRFPILEALAGAAGRDVASLAAVFDESTLWRDTTAATSSAADLGELRYPPDAKGVVKLWWTGSGDLEIAHDDYTIRLRVDGGAPTEVVLRPDELEPVTIAVRLDDALADLNTAVIDPDIPLRLPFPHALADPGDAAPTRAAHDDLADDFQEVGTSEEEAYVLAGTPRALVASRVAGRVPPGQQLGPLPVVPGPTLGDLDDSALGIAADVAALLNAGASPVLGNVTANTAGLPVIANPVPPPVYQVFRQWNLDERRLNEWREIVTGGAVSDTATPAAHHSGIRPHPNAAAYASAVPGGADVLADMGWVPAFRAWLRMATDVTTDSSATTAEPYTPTVQRRDGTTAAPTNQQLTDAMRFLFDLP